MTDRPRRAYESEDRGAEELPESEEAEEIVIPPTDPVREAKEHDVEDPADVDVDPEEWRQGGPTRSPGAVTTTGGSAGPAMRPKPGRQDPDRAGPTTPGDATSGGMQPSTGGSTSDASDPSGTGEPVEEEPE